VTGPVDVQNLLFSFNGKLENFYLPGVYNIESIPFIFFLKNKVPFMKGALNGNCLDFF
jgi:hypothetical protein